MKSKKAEYQMDRVLKFMEASLAKLGRAPTAEEVQAYLVQKRLASAERAAELARLYADSAKLMGEFHQKSTRLLRRIRQKKRAS
jgi:hypothetical protein